MLFIWKWMGPDLMKNHLVRFWNYFLFLNWTDVITFPLLLKLPVTKLELWFVLSSFFPPRLCFISINLISGLVWTKMVMSGIFLLTSSWICWTCYKNGYLRLLVLHMLPLSWTLCSISKCDQPIYIFRRYYFRRYSCELATLPCYRWVICPPRAIFWNSLPAKSFCLI